MSRISFRRGDCDARISLCGPSIVSWILWDRMNFPLEEEVEVEVESDADIGITVAVVVVLQMLLFGEKDCVLVTRRDSMLVSCWILRLIVS